MSDLVLYTSNDGRTRLDLRIEGRTVWLTQLEIAELFQTTKQNVSLHAKNIFSDGELSPEATVKESLTLATASINPSTGIGSTFAGASENSQSNVNNPKTIITGPPDSFIALAPYRFRSKPMQTAA